MFKSLHEKINNTLQPAQGLTTVVLLVAAGVCLYAAFAIKDPTARTAIAAWIIAP